MSTNNGSAVFGLVDTSDLRGIYSTDSVKVGDTIKTGLVSSDPDHSHSWQTESYSWQTSSDNSTWNEVGTSSTYTLLAADDDKSIRCEVSYTDNQGFNEELYEDLNREIYELYDLTNEEIGLVEKNTAIN